MIVRSTPRLARWGPRFRDAVLLLFALFVAHDAVFVAQFGFGSRFAAAMTEGGHDAYWAPFSIGVTLGVALIFVVSVGVVARLERRAHGVVRNDAPGPSYLRELSSTWLRLLLSVAVLFTVQENLEHLVVDGHIVGADVLFGPGTSVVLPVLAATTFILSAVGALVRWRIHVLEARIATEQRQSFARPAAIQLPTKWGAIAACIAHRWILARRDVGRAPPAIPSRDAVATA